MTNTPYMENCPCHLNTLPFSYILSRSKFHYVSWQNKKCPFKKNLCVCTYMCRPVCASVEARGQQWMSPSSSLIFWDKNSHWIWSSASVTPGAAQHCPLSIAVTFSPERLRLLAEYPEASLAHWRSRGGGSVDTYLPQVSAVTCSVPPTLCRSPAPTTQGLEASGALE